MRREEKNARMAVRTYQKKQRPDLHYFLCVLRQNGFRATGTRLIKKLCIVKLPLSENL